MHPIISKIYCVFGFITCSWIIPIPFLIIRPIVKQISNSDYCSWGVTLKYIIMDHWLNAKVVIVKGAPMKTGFILPNHRSFADFVIDPGYSNGCGIGRREAFWCLLPAYWLGLIDSHCLSFTRGQTDRHQLYTRCKHHFNTTTDRPLVVWPEGTRLKYLGLKSPNSIKRLFKLGLLKSIWEDAVATLTYEPPIGVGGWEAGKIDIPVQHPVQVMISNNKEVLLDEKKLHLQRGVEIQIVFGDLIYPTDYETFDQFIDAIACEWYIAYKLAHDV
jgi:hypothetical protein